MPEVEAAKLSELPQGMSLADIGGVKLLLVRDGDEVQALEGLCPHAGAPLHKGALCDGRIICPWHMGTFDARTGALLEPVAMRGLRTYAVRLAGDDVMVDPSPIELPSASPASAGADPRVFVLVGTGAAAATAAVTLRGNGFGGRLVMIGPEAKEPLDRTQFSKSAIGDKDFDLNWLALIDAPAQQALSIEREVSTVTALDPAARRLTTSTGQVFSYDAALLATGAAPIPLDVPGGDAHGVRCLRTFRDVEAILSRVVEGERAIVVGSSFIGMEAASALVQRKMDVTVVSQDAAAPFAKQFGPRVADAIKTLHENKGVKFHLGAEVARIDAGSVTLGSGEALPASLVVVGAGVRPVLDYAGQMTRAPNGGLAVDDSLQAAEAVWAAGDIASPTDWPRIEHWRLAQQHGRVAALGMLGHKATYQGVPFFWTAQHGKVLRYIGEASKWDAIEYDGDVEKFTFIAWYLQDGCVTAALTCGRDRACALLSHKLKSQLSLADARALVASEAAPIARWQER